MKTYKSFDGLRLAYRDQGSGLPLLCLAGLTRNSQDFDYLVPHLPNVRLICPDYRGRGASDWPDDSATYAWDIEARDVVDLLDHLGLDKVAILGTSRGGMIAMYLAGTTRDRISGVCLNDIGPELQPAGLNRIKAYVGQQPEPSTIAELAATLQAKSPDFANVPSERWMDEARHRTIETPEGLALAYDPRLKHRLDGDLVETPPDFWPLFDQMADLPLALIRGANSDLLSQETAAEMGRRRPDMIFADIPDRGHVPFLDEPLALTAITTWLETCA